VIKLEREWIYTKALGKILVPSTIIIGVDRLVHFDKRVLQMKLSASTTNLAKYLKSWMGLANWCDDIVDELLWELP
jgi:hypothetical protein